MKKMIFALMAMVAMTIQANAMSYEQARNEALFLTDKMAYELNLTDAQYEAAYEINLDYLMSVSTVDDVFSTYWERRNLDLSYILYSWQWNAFRAATYFYRPLYWDAGFWHFRIYTRYPHRDYFFFGRPHFYATYRGGHSWHVNGGRSYYHSRIDHFRPAPRADQQHFGMRNKFDRGDYRGARGNSSTRITAGRNNAPAAGGNRNGSFGNHRNSSANNNNAPASRGTDAAKSPTLQRGLNSNATTPSRHFGSGSSATQRSSSSTTPSHTATPNTTAPQRNSSNFGGNRNSSSQPKATPRSSQSAGSRSSSATRSSGSRTQSSSSRSGNGGHFGGSRNR